MGKKNAQEDVRDLIMSHLKVDSRDLAWLSIKTDIPYPTLYSILKRKERSLTDEKRVTINEVLNTNY